MSLPAYRVKELSEEFKRIQAASKPNKGLGFDSCNSPLIDNLVNRYSIYVKEMRESSR